MRATKKYKKGGKVKAVKKPPTDPSKEKMLAAATENKDIDYMPSIQPQRLDSIDSSVTSKNPYFGNKEEIYLPLDFYSDWLNSSMYKNMMEGKESINDRLRVEPSSVYGDNEDETQKLFQKFGYKPGLDDKVSITDARKENLSRTKVEEYGKYDIENVVNLGEQMTGEEKDSDGNIINKYPLIKLRNEEARSFDGELMSDNDFNRFLTTLSHEFSHASDNDMPMYDGSSLFYKTNPPAYYEYHKLPIPKESISLEGKPGYGDRSKLIPTQDIDLIRSFVDKNKKVNFKNNYPEFSRTLQRYKYVTEPTEVRARINSQRYDLFKEGLFNPFSEKMTKDKLDKIREYTIKSGKQDMKDLFNFFSDDQIIQMFNSIAMEDTDESTGRTFNFA